MMRQADAIVEYRVFGYEFHFVLSNPEQASAVTLQQLQDINLMRPLYFLIFLWCHGL